jgi:hypothetical protein
MELLRSWQLSRKKIEGGVYWPGPQQLPVHRSQWKFIFPIGHISFKIRLDSMLKLIRNYINPNGFAVGVLVVCPKSHDTVPCVGLILCTRRWL